MSIDERRFYFDFTDIILHCHDQSRVSGIQRVALNVIRGMAERYGCERIRCVFDDGSGQIVECSPSFLLHEDEFDGESIMFRLGLLKGWQIFPSKLRIRAHLHSYANTRRKLKKLQIQIYALFFPARLRRLGLKTVGERFKGIHRVATREFLGLKSADCLVLPGGNWTWSTIHELMCGHALRGGDVVQMIYDLVPIKTPEYCEAHLVKNYSRWLDKIVLCPIRYLCISENTARDLRVFLTERGKNSLCVAIRLAHEFIGVARNARQEAPSDRVQSISHHPYILCVGTIEIRKNGAMLLRAWQRLRTELGDRLPVLIFAGRRGWKTGEFDAVLNEHPTLQQSVLIVDSPSDIELAHLYGNCLFTVFPSLYEGWGLPVGESAWFGKYCVASNSSSIPEVCGDLMDYIDPSNENDLVNKLRQAINDTDYVRSRERRIVASPLRRWDEVTTEISQLIFAGESVSEDSVETVNGRS